MRHSLIVAALSQAHAAGALASGNNASRNTRQVTFRLCLTFSELCTFHRPFDKPRNACDLLLPEVVVPPGSACCQPCLPLAGISPSGVPITATADDGTASSRSWMSEWTIFYYGWWIAWAPFVGMFIAKISRGRTVRTIINGGMSAPVLYACALLRCLLACVACAGRASVLPPCCAH